MKWLNRVNVSVLRLLIWLTVLFVSAQLLVFMIHYKVTDLVDSMVNASIALQLLHPVVLLPLLIFVMMQLLAYGLFVGWIWFLTLSLSELFVVSKSKIYGLGVLIWLVACVTLLALNQYYFPGSFFAKWGSYLTRLHAGQIVLWVFLPGLILATLLAYVNFFWFKRYHRSGVVLLLCVMSLLAITVYDKVLASRTLVSTATNKVPNIIFIGLDSLRPDFTGFFGKQAYTPNIDAFLQSSAYFTEAYTPLARTFPAWMSVLTGKYPKHSEARNNLVEPEAVIKNDTLAKHLQQAGYETVYATDEKRFSNVTTDYGFDRILGPSMGVNDFLLGGLSDFPLSNLLVNLPLGRFLFPYNYANRAAAITYEPDKFLQLVRLGLAQRSQKPLFLAVHLCLSHWPFTWARDGLSANMKMSNQYQHSVEGVDRQLGALLTILKENGLLENSLVVLLSDHGTALGLPGDRMIADRNYRGDAKDLPLVPKLKLSSAPGYGAKKPEYTINTSYGQGTNVLSNKQYHVLLAVKRFGENISPHALSMRVSLIDIAPTVLDFLHLAPMPLVDGISLYDDIANLGKTKIIPRAFYLETGDSLSEIETDHIYIEKVIKHQIGIYTIDPQKGLLMMDALAEQAILKNKQLAILRGDWLLAHFPPKLEKKWVTSQSSHKVMKSSIVPAYFVLVNVKTGQWTIGLASPFAKQAPVVDLLGQLKRFYGDELPK